MKQGRAARVHLIPSGFHSKYFDYRVSHTCCTSLKPLESTLKVKGENVIFRLPFFIPYIFPIVTSHSVAQMVRNLPAMHETGFNPWVMKISWRKAPPTFQVPLLSSVLEIIFLATHSYLWTLVIIPANPLSVASSYLPLPLLHQTTILPLSELYLGLIFNHK